MIREALLSAAGTLARLAGAAPRGSSARHIRAIRAAFDGATDRGFDSKTWAETDALSADAAGSPGVRARLRERCRHVVHNWPIARGIVDTLAHDTVGTGPRLSVLVADDGMPGLTPDDADQVERAWGRWWSGSRMSEKLRLMRVAKCQDGESFLRLVDNPALIGLSGVSLDARIIEADQVQTPEPMLERPEEVDGIVFDRWGNPRLYRILRYHPGDDRVGVNPLDADNVRSADVLHYFHALRPGQSRGVPELAAAVRLFAHQWRYYSATIQAAETAANVAAYMTTTTTFDQDADSLFDALEVEAGTVLTLPEGWDLKQLRAEHPSAMFAEVQRSLIATIARCVCMPVNVAMGDSSSHNYASGRLDHQIYRAAIDTERQRIESVILEPLFRAWLAEARFAGLVPDAATTLEGVAHTWRWPAYRHVDPQKEAGATETKLRYGGTTLAEVWAEKGEDWRDGVAQIARERKELARLGITLGETTGQPTAAPRDRQRTATGPDRDEDGDDDDE